MAGIMNRTARQFNLKGCSEKGHMVTIRVAPGFNVVNDQHWEAFVSEKGKILSPFVQELVDKKYIRFGERENDMELEQEPDTVAKSKSVPTAQTKDELNKTIKKPPKKGKTKKDK